MSVKNHPQKHLSRPALQTESYNLASEHDNKERQEVISRLTQHLDQTANSETIKFEHIFISLEQGSTLEITLRPGVQLLRKILESEAFSKFRNILKLPSHTIFGITSEGILNATVSGHHQNIPNAHKLSPALKEDLDLLIEMAGLTGGSISQDERVGLVSWLKFHGYAVPQTVSDCRKLIAYFNYTPPASPPFGNYWDMIKSAQEHSTTLSADQRAQLLQLTKSQIPGRSLLDHLADSVLGTDLLPFERSEAEEILKKLVSNFIGSIWARALVQNLGWYGAQEDQPQSEESLQQILLTALLLDLHPMIGEQEPRNHIAGFNLYAPRHVEKSFADIQTAFEIHLIEHHRISERNVTLAAHLLLAHAAPEFLVRDVPPELLAGTPPWVDFCRTVEVQESIAPGSTRLMTYAQIQQLSQFESVSESHRTLNTLAAVDPVIDWALLNSLVTLEDVNKSMKDSLDVALAAYTRRNEALAATAAILARPLPTRRAIALEILEQVAKGCTYLEKDVLHQVRNRPLGDAFTDLSMSPVELLMSHDLATGDWDVKKGESMYTAFPRLLPNLVPPDGEFHRRFNRDYVAHEQAMSGHLKHALCALPLADRKRLLKGQLTLYSVRPSVAKEHSITRPPTNVISSTLEAILKVTGRRPMESLEDIKEATGRYGVVICSVFEGRMTCYELFTLHGICRENPGLAGVIETKNLRHSPVRDREYELPAPLLNLPTDIECYTHGVTPGLVSTSQAILEKIGELPSPLLPPGSQDKNQYQSFFSNDFDPLVNYVQKHRPIAAYSELVKECWGQTRLEALRAEREKALDTFLDFVVPFKSCIQDLNSDDIVRQSEGFAACVLETAMTLLLVVGAVAKIASIVVKSASIATKAGAIAKAGLGLANSLFNPLDGIPDLLKSGTKLLRKGLNSQLSTVGDALTDLRRLSGNSPYRRPIMSVDSTVIHLGTSSSFDASLVLAIRNNDHWYALNRIGEPWGAPLKGFQPRNVWRAFKLDKLMPVNYTRKLLKEALPVARTKVDNAISILKDAAYDFDSRKVLKMLLGDDSASARQRYLNHLDEVKNDFTKITSRNFIMDESPSDSLAALNPGLYDDWVLMPPSKAAEHKFMRIHVHNFNKEFHREGFSPDVLADVIVHEVFHGAPNTLDHAYALGPAASRTGHHQQLNLAPLLNLASGNLRDPQTLKLIDKANTFNNADSFALTTSLLAQLSTDPATCLENIATMSKALERSQNGYIGWEVLIKLNPV